MSARCTPRPALRVAALVAGLVLAAPLAPAAAAQARPATPVLVLEGTGWGHGVGLSQWGANYLARAGLSTEGILETFYPGAQIGEADGPMRVAVHQPPSATTTLTFPQGGEVRSPASGEQHPGFPVRVGRGGRVRITFDGAYRVVALVTGQSSSATPYQQDCQLLGLICPTTTTQPPTTTTTRPPSSTPSSPTTTPPGGGGDGDGTAPPPPPPPAPEGATASSGGPVVAVPSEGGVTSVDDRGRSYRGILEATGAGALRLVNHVGLEDYLRGMAEVPGTWPAAAVQAQTVAARTYALRAMQGGGEICDDARCQVYVGVGAESAGQNEAVAATARRVLTYGGALAAAVYSADAGGVSATTLEGFGTPDGVYPYLQARPYETDNPLPWNLVVGYGDIGSRLGYRGTVTGVRVAAAGPSGRALEMVLEGSAGDMVVDGRQFARSLGLRSTRFTAAPGMSDGTPPPPPPAESEIQALPDEVGRLARTPVLPRHELQLDRARPRAPATSMAASLPPVLDPRRHPTTLVAVLVLAFVAGFAGPVALALPRGGLSGWPRWRIRLRGR